MALRRLWVQIPSGPQIMSKALVSILAGLGGMFGWGVSDFFANLSSGKIGHSKSFFWSQLAGLLLIVIVVVITAPVFNITSALWPFVVLSGVGYTIGYLFLYKGFEVGNVSVVSVVINFNAVLTMLVAYFIYGQRLKGLQIPAVILILLGIALVSVNFKEVLNSKRNLLLKGAKEAIVASVGFGIIHWPITEYVVERASWMWDALLVKVISLIFVFALFLYKNEKLNLPKNVKNAGRTVIIVGVLEALAILSVNFGFTIGDSILVSPIANSVAVVTVSMAAIFLKEKITKVQLIGIIATITGIILSAF